MSDEVEGFAMMPRSLQRDETLSGHAKLVYLALSSRTNGAGQCWPSHRRIAVESSCSVASVKRALEELRARGYVTWKPRQTDQSGQSSNLYTLHLAPQTVGQEGVAHSELPGSSDRATNETHVNETQDSPVSTSALTSRCQTGDDSVNIAPTARQLATLERSGYAGPPRTRREASELIKRSQRADLATKAQVDLIADFASTLTGTREILDGYDPRVWPTKTQADEWLPILRRAWYEAGNYDEGPERRADLHWSTAS